VQNFIKQLLLYIEEHINEDMETMLSLADVLKNISFSMRAFPQPYIIIKSELYKHFNPFHIYVASDEQPKKKASIGKAENPAPAMSSDDKPPKGEANSEPKAEAPTRMSAPVQSHDDDDLTNDELLGKLTNSIDKVSLRGLVKSFCLIERQEKDTIYFVVLQKIQLGILQKQENLKAIETALSTILGRPVHAAMRYQSKDEYFSSLLG